MEALLGKQGQIISSLGTPYSENSYTGTANEDTMSVPPPPAVNKSDTTVLFGALENQIRSLKSPRKWFQFFVWAPSTKRAKAR